MGRERAARAVSKRPPFAANRPKPAELRQFVRLRYWTPEEPKVGGGAGSLERTRLRWKFPDNPRFTGKFRKITGNARRGASNYRMLSVGYGQIP